MLVQRLLDKERVNQHQTVLQELEAERGDLLLLATIGGKDTLTAIAEEVSGFIPALDDVQTSFHLMTELERGQILAEVDGLLDLAEFGQRLVRRMGDVVG